MSTFDTPKFKKLQIEYYRKLQDSGFEDIEKGKEFGQHRVRTQQIDLRRLIAFQPEVYEFTVDYFRWAEHALNWAQFQSRTDEMIWSLHADGATAREIAAAVCFDQTHVSRRIKKIGEYLRSQDPESSI